MFEQVSLRNKLQPTRKGAMVVAGLLVFGLLILGGLYISPKAHSPAAPANVPIGTPGRKLRFVSYDLARQRPANDPMFGQIMKLEPDYVLLQGVNEDEAVEIAERLGLQKSFHPQLYQRSEHLAGRKGTWGNLILSRQTLYEGAPLGGKRGGFGAWAASIVDGKEFFVADLHTAAGEQGAAEAAELQQVWKAKSSPPMVVAVLPSEAVPPAGLQFLWAATPSSGEWFYVSKDWVVTGSGTAGIGGSGLAPRWIDVARAGAAAATQEAK